MANLKLFVWEEVLTDYTDGIMFALATSADEARKMILEKNDVRRIRENLEKPPLEVAEPCAFIVWGGS